MTVKALTNPYVTLGRGDVWVIDVRVFDADRVPVSDTLTVTVTDPNGTESTPAAAATDPAGCYRASVTLGVAGRWVAQVATAANGMTALTAAADPLTTAAQMPTIVDVSDYLGQHSATDADLDEALAAETRAQAKVCRVPAWYPPDLRSALLRRCARHLAMKRIPLAVLQGDADTGPTVPPGRDPEVRRFEAGYRRLPVG